MRAPVACVALFLATTSHAQLPDRTFAIQEALRCRDLDVAIEIGETLFRAMSANKVSGVGSILFGSKAIGCVILQQPNSSIDHKLWNAQPLAEHSTRFLNIPVVIRVIDEQAPNQRRYLVMVGEDVTAMLNEGGRK